MRSIIAMLHFARNCGSLKFSVFTQRLEMVGLVNWSMISQPYRQTRNTSLHQARTESLLPKSSPMLPLSTTTKRRKSDFSVRKTFNACCNLLNLGIESRKQQRANELPTSNLASSLLRKLQVHQLLQCVQEKIPVSGTDSGWKIY